VLGEVIKKYRVRLMLLHRETNLTEEQYLQVIK
jgi:hypothetical protein